MEQNDQLEENKDFFQGKQLFNTNYYNNQKEEGQENEK
jgi:hypothetical protein